MSALNDDPYLAELLDLTNDELGDGGNGGKKAGVAAAGSTSKASAATAAAAASSSSSQPSPAKAPSYRSSGAWFGSSITNKLNRSP